MDVEEVTLSALLASWEISTSGIEQITKECTAVNDLRYIKPNDVRDLFGLTTVDFLKYRHFWEKRFVSVAVDSQSSEHTDLSSDEHNFSQDSSNEEISDYLTKQLSFIVSSFHENTGMTETIVQEFVESFVSFQQDTLYCAVQHLHQRYEREDQDCEHIQQFVGDLKLVLNNSFQPLSSAFRRYKYFQSVGTMIPPQAVTVGIREKVVGSDPPAQPVDVNAQFIPMRTILTKLFEIPSFLDEVIDWAKTCASSSEVVNLSQSPLWLEACSRRDPSDGSLFFALTVYFDDFEGGNPLGSHSGVRKLGATYMGLPFLPPRFVSKLKFIFLILIFNSRDRSLLGNKAIFKPVIDELHFLYYTGITVRLPDGQTRVIKFGLGCLIGDNLGLNDIMGFTTSFNSLRCCRLCRASKHEFRDLTVESDMLLRDTNNYAADLQSAESGDTTTGVVERCVWLDVPNFSIHKHSSVDLMHDLHEGVARYVMVVVLRGLITRNSSFTLEYLNSQITNFQYGSDFGSRPPTIAASKGGSFNIRMSASEMITFVTYFGLMVGHNVEGYDEFEECDVSVERNAQQPKKKKKRFDDSPQFYHLYVLLRKTITVITHDCTSPQRSAYVAHVIQCFLTHYTKMSDLLKGCSEDTKLQPKFHLLTHYPSEMVKHGPLSALSSIRFESKHRALKKAITSCSSSVNTPYTVAKKVQYQLNHLLTIKHLPSRVHEPGKLFRVLEGEVNGLRKALGVPDNVILRKTKLVTSSDNVTFRPEQTLCVDTYEGNPVFFKITKIFYALESGDVFFEGQSYITVAFSTHFQAYEIELFKEISYQSLSALPYPFPDTMTLGLDGNLYVTSRNSM